MLGVAVLFTPLNAHSDSDMSTEIKFEHIMAIDVHDQSVVVYSQTETPVICQVEYSPTKNSLSESFVVSHSDVPHTGHIVKILDLLPNTKYEFGYVTEIDDQKIHSEKSSFMTLQS